MGDLSGAKRHFEGLRHGGDKDEYAVLDGRLALICLKMGDVEGARRYIGAGEHEAMTVIEPLLSMAEGRYEDAIEEWRSLQGGPHDTVATQNLAVCLLYIGKLDEVSGTFHILSAERLPLPLLHIDRPKCAPFASDILQSIFP